MLKQYSFTAIKGLVIGGTMLVPGVSGGSMAMILGIYQKLISAISSFWENKKKNLIFGAPSVRKVPQGGFCIKIE